MAQFHFVEDYQELVNSLIKNYPLDEAMSMAVGGRWEEVGVKCADALVANGLSDKMNVIDFGCGSGRVAYALSNRVNIKQFVGIDIIQQLLAYAESKCPPNYKFILNRSLDIPIRDNCIDFAYAFSVFTHLLQTEIHLYKKEIYKKLVKGGTFLYSFLELDNHWDVFESSVASNYKHNRPYPHLNMFLDRNQIKLMSDNIGFKVIKFIEPNDSKLGVGQTIVVLKKI